MCVPYSTAFGILQFDVPNDSKIIVIFTPNDCMYHVPVDDKKVKQNSDGNVKGTAKLCVQLQNNLEGKRMEARSFPCFHSSDSSDISFFRKLGNYFESKYTHIWR
eukprot:scpid32542/ scgid28644/ 